MTRVLVVGSGLAGLWTAVRAADLGNDVTLVTKGALAEANTQHAQGGIAAAIFPGDSPERHVQDTLAAGAGHCDEAAVRVLCSDGAARIRDLIRFGVVFDRDGSGPVPGLEAAHTRARILHAGGDATGAAIEDAFIATLHRRAITVVEHTTLVDILTDTAPVRACGLRMLGATGTLTELTADVVVLATGGTGQLFAHTTNPAVATGDGVTAAWRAGARVADLEFIQFHPTALDAPGAPLISEAVRGEGALLVDANGRRFMLSIDPRGELAPRDVVARGVAGQAAAQGSPVRLDATGLGGAFLRTRFPTIDRAVRAAGLDWAETPIPVSPAAHYAMGGIATDQDGRTSIPGLYAVGECARTGVHGANRLASNSLLEAAVFGERVARAVGTPDVTEWAAARAGGDARSDHGWVGVASEAVADLGFPVVDAFDRADLQARLWSDGGLTRDGERLATLHRRLAGIPRTATDDPLTRAHVEDRNLLDLALLTVAAASARRRSLGAHFRVDDPALA